MASNRVGKELMNTFYGGSFIAGPTGEIRAQVCSSHWQHGHGGFDPRLTLTLLSAMQIGKQTEGDLIDPKPDRHEGVAVYSFDLDDIRGTRARCACCHHAEHASGCMQGPSAHRHDLPCAAGGCSATGGRTCTGHCLPWTARQP